MILGCDVSTHQDAPATPVVTDFVKMKAAGARFVYIKSSQGDFRDADFVTHWTNSKGIMPRGLYHYYDWVYSLETNVNTFVQAIIDYPTEMPPALDWESLVNAPDRATAEATCLQFLQMVEAKTGRRPIVYTSKYKWSLIGGPNPAFSAYKLWVAAYGYDTPPIPEPWKTYTIWQYDNEGSGSTFGVESQFIDLNYFNGDETALNEFAGVIKPPEEIVLFKAKCTASVLNVRSGPGIAYPVIGSMVLGQIVNVYEEKLGWYRHGVGRWSSSSYLKKEDLPIVLPPPPAVAPDVLYYPLAEGKHYITQMFGLNPQWYPTSRGHNGIDWGVPVGNPIYAMQDGVVITAVAQTTGYGRHVRIQHHNGISIYGHLSALGVVVGQQVQARQEIGKSGGAVTDPYCGYSTGPHLHAEFRPSVFPPPAPGSYVYGAVDIMPLLASHSYDGTPDPVLFRAKVTAYYLNTRYGPATTFYTNGGLKQDEIVNVYEERNGWYRISDQCERWCAGWYTAKINDPVYTNYMPIVTK